jgi:hypothetical protein
MSSDKKDGPTGQDAQQQPKPAIVSAAADDGGRNRGKEKFGGEFHSVKTVLEIVGLIAALIVAALGAQAWIENRIENAVETKTRSMLSDETILRKIAAESRPSLIFDGTGAILHDMGAVQYLKPDDIRIVERHEWGGILLPSKLHIGFVRPVSFAPLVTPLNDAAMVSASHGRGLDWEFTINWTVIVEENTNDSVRVFRLEVVP